jgi:DNA primase
VAGSELSLEDFKARLPLAEIVGRYVKLTRRGREHQGLCPFHKEKTPSFNVVEDKGFYHCFGCGAHGTAIDFVMAIESLTFPEALERLADLTGIAAPRRVMAGQTEPSQRLHAANAAAAAWFQAQLGGGSGREAQAYLERRGLSRDIVKDFGLGYAPNERFAMRRALMAQGFAEAELLAAGLLAQADGQGEGFDRFRHRIMFPIADERGRIVAFGGRALGDARAKYLNTAQTEIFHKGELLYNHHRASRPARERREVLLAEGYMDVIALAQAGFTHAVAPLGTAITERQLALLWKLAEAPTVCLDGDRAGLAAALHVAEHALPLMRGGQTLRFAMLPDGEDPDSFLRRHGNGPLRAILDKAQHLSVFVWSALNEHSFRNLDLDRPEQIAALRRKLRSFEAKAADPDIRLGLKRRFGELLEERLAGIRQSRQRTVTSRPRSGDHRRGPSGVGAGSTAGGRIPGWSGVGSPGLEAALARQETSREARVLLPLLRHPEWLSGCEDDFSSLQLTDSRLELLRQEIVTWFVDNGNLDAEGLQRHLLRYGFGPLLDQFAADLTQPTATGNDIDDAEHRRSWRGMLAAIRHRAALHQERPTEEDLRRGNGEQVNRLFNRLDRLLNRDGADDADSDEGSTNAAG